MRGQRAAGLLLALALFAPAGGAGAEPCSPATARRGVPGSAELRPGLVPAAGTGDYRDRLGTTALGWPRLDRWCVWMEPAAAAGESIWERRWREAVEAALATWSRELMIQRVADPEAAQILVRRRRPPLRRDPEGRTRASHGRALLELTWVERDGIGRLEPSVQVLLSPDQRAAALQATALHELGHAFGLWGHSGDPADVMAAAPGATPLLLLSPRDRATLRWLYAQPSRFGIRSFLSGQGRKAISRWSTLRRIRSST